MKFIFDKFDVDPKDGDISMLEIKMMLKNRHLAIDSDDDQEEWIQIEKVFDVHENYGDKSEDRK